MEKPDFKLAIRITWIVILICIIAMGTLVKVYLIDNQWDADLSYLVFSVPLFISSLVLIMFLYNLRRAYSQQQTEIEGGSVLARWTYSDDEWTRFNALEWKRSWQRAVFIPLGCLLFFFLITVADPEIAVALPWLTVFLVSLGLVLLYYTYSMYKRTFTCPREVIIGRKGVLYGGFYNSWDLIGTHLGDVTILQGNIPMLNFDIQVWGKYGNNSRPLRIPIPSGREQDAQEVIEKLTTKKA